MDKTPTPTQGPWEVTSEMFGIGGHLVAGIVASNNYPIANLGIGETGKANAAHIVKCVNAHESLVKALELLMKAEPMQQGERNGYIMGAISSAIDAARKALEQVRK